MITTNFDVIVCGGGPSGVASAISAARQGAKTLLIERYGFCGGMATAALVNPWSGHEFTDPVTKLNGSIIGGVFGEIVMKMWQRGGYGSELSPAAFDEELLKHVYDEMLVEAGVHIMFHTFIKDVNASDNRINHITVYSKEGKANFSAKVFIDCTGDADLAVVAKIPFSVGRAEDGLTQAMTVSFRMGNVDKEEMIKTKHVRAARGLVEPYFQQALADGSLHYPYRPFIHFYDYPRPGILHFNMTRINEVSGLSTADLTKAEIEGRRQAYVIGEWLIKNVPYFKNAFVEKIACQVGVRETRHIHGLYTVTQDDIVRAKKFEDGIVRSRYFIDIHNPKGAHDVQQKAGTAGALNHDFGPPPGDYYEVPYRSLVTNDCDNLIVACRALSATHEASAAIRVMATMHGIGEAAGIAASKASKDNLKVADVSGKWVRDQIPYLNQPADYNDPWKAENGFPWSEVSAVKPVEA